MNFRSIAKCFLVCSLFLSLIACENKGTEPSVDITSIALASDSITMEVSQSQQMDVSLQPAGANASELSWGTTAEAVATVDANGVISAVGRGTAKIFAVYKNVSDTVIVRTVTKIISGITLPTSSITLNVGETYTVNPDLQPSDANKADLTWSVDNEKVAVVDENGVITAVGYGRTFVYAKFGDISRIMSVSVNEPVRQYELVWEDNFDGTSIDGSKWNVRRGIPTNNEKQYYQEDNVTVQDGCLVFTAKKESVNGKAYTSGQVNSQGKGYIKYGKIEASINFPSGAGTWAAFWMMPNESAYGGWPRSGEIDIVEHIGSNPNRVSVATHTYERNGNVGTQGSAWSAIRSFENTADNFHTYGVEWINDYENGSDILIFTFDGTVISSCKQESWLTSDWQDWPFDQNFYIILNLAIGGSFAGAEPIDDSIFPVQMKVDWVRMYKLVD